MSKTRPCEIAQRFVLAALRMMSCFERGGYGLEIHMQTTKPLFVFHLNLVCMGSWQNLKQFEIGFDTVGVKDEGPVCQSIFMQAGAGNFEPEHWNQTINSGFLLSYSVLKHNKSYIVIIYSFTVSHLHKICKIVCIRHEVHINCIDKL